MNDGGDCNGARGVVKVEVLQWQDGSDSNEVTMAITGNWRLR